MLRSRLSPSMLAQSGRLHAGVTCPAPGFAAAFWFGAWARWPPMLMPKLLTARAVHTANAKDPSIARGAHVQPDVMHLAAKRHSMPKAMQPRLGARQPHQTNCHSPGSWSCAIRISTTSECVNIRRESEEGRRNSTAPAFSGPPPPSSGLSGLDRQPLRASSRLAVRGQTVSEGQRGLGPGFGPRLIEDGLKPLKMLEICVNWERLNRSPTGRKQSLDDLVGRRAGMRSPALAPVTSKQIIFPHRADHWARPWRPPKAWLPPQIGIKVETLGPRRRDDGHDWCRVSRPRSRL
jgi:hypothetical protein